METNKRKEVLIITLASVFLVAASFFLSRGGLPASNSNNGAPATVNDLSGKKNWNFDNWKTYRSQVLGFEIKYPGYFTEEKYIDIRAGAGDANCGKMVERTFEVSSGNDRQMQSYRFSIYSNYLKLKPTDFFDCLKKSELGNAYDAGKIESVEVSSMGSQGGDIAIIGEGRATTAIIFANGNIYEIRQEARVRDDASKDELNQMLSTAKFSEIGADLQTKKTMDFCAAENEGEFGKGILAFSEAIATGGATAKEALVGCQVTFNTDQNEWMANHPINLYHVVDDGKGGYDIVWQNSTREEGLNWLYITTPASAGDLDGDGAQEIFFSGKGACAQNCSQWCLYVPMDKKLFCATSVTRAEASGENVTIEGKDCVTDSSAAHCQGECTVLKRTLCFDKIGEDQRYGMFKEYLQNNIAPGI